LKQLWVLTTHQTPQPQQQYHPAAPKGDLTDDNFHGQLSMLFEKMSSYCYKVLQCQAQSILECLKVQTFGVCSSCKSSNRDAFNIPGFGSIHSGKP
jgi:hypothetical protein